MVLLGKSIICLIETHETVTWVCRRRSAIIHIWEESRKTKSEERSQGQHLFIRRDPKGEGREENGQEDWPNGKIGGPAWQHDSRRQAICQRHEPTIDKGNNN